MRRYQPLPVLVAVTILLGGLLSAPIGAHAAPPEVCFMETDQCIQGRFLEYWQANGGLARNGYPLTGERRELLEDGNEYTVQYFERVRLELHPENLPPHDVLLGQLGWRVLRERFGYNAAGYQAATASIAPLPDRVYFPETGHSLGGQFLAYWQANGGLAQFGYPVTEEFAEDLREVGPGAPRMHRVQYFERARLEYHPENQPPYDLLLGQFGRTILAEANFLPGRFGALYLTDVRVRELLGSPTSPPNPALGATLLFERGRMIYQQVQDSFGLIYVLCGTPQSGQVLHPRGYQYFANRPAAGPSTGGPGPRAGLYEPQLGFGRLWRENQEVRACLGYATSPDETPYTLTWQAFTRGMILSVPEEGVAYLLVNEDVEWVRISYERFVLPAR